MSISKDVSKDGVEYFKDIFKEDARASNTEVVKMAIVFPHFVSKEYNEILGAMVTKEEFHVVLQSFKKDKSPGLNKWAVEMFMCLYIQRL